MRALSLAHCSIKSAHAEMERQSTKRRSSHERYPKKNPRWSYQQGMEWSINALSWETFPNLLNAIPLPDIKWLKLSLQKRYFKKNPPKPRKERGSLLTHFTPLLWAPPSWAPLWLPPHLPTTRLVASPAPPLRPSALQREAVVTTAHCGRAAPSMGWLEL